MSDNNDVQAWIRGFEQEAERYSFQVIKTAVTGDNITIVFKNKNGAYFLGVSTIQDHPSNMSPIGPYGNIESRKDGNYLCEDTFGSELYDPQGELLFSRRPPALAGRHLFEYI